jgi:phage-related tail protein
MPKKIVPTPAPARITVGEKILARMDEVLSHVSGQEDLLTDLDARVGALNDQIRGVTRLLIDVGTRLAHLENVAEDAWKSAEAAEIAADYAGKEVERLTAAMPDVNEIVDSIRRQERIEWLASTKPAF